MCMCIRSRASSTDLNLPTFSFVHTSLCISKFSVHCVVAVAVVVVVVVDCSWGEHTTEAEVAKQW